MGFARKSRGGVPGAEVSGQVGRWLDAAFEHRRRLATVAAGVLTVAVAYHVVFGHNGLTVYEQKRHETQILERQLKDLTKENENLQGHVERLQTDPNAIEHQAREELHYTRAGEVIVTLPPDHLAEKKKR